MIFQLIWVIWLNFFVFISNWSVEAPFAVKVSLQQNKKFFFSKRKQSILALQCIIHKWKQISCMDVSWFRHQIDAIRISERTFDFPLTWTRFHRKTLCAAIRLQYTIQWKRQLNWKCSLESLYLFAIDCSKSDQKIINDPTTREKNWILHQLQNMNGKYFDQKHKISENRIVTQKIRLYEIQLEITSNYCAFHQRPIILAAFGRGFSL